MLKISDTSQFTTLSITTINILSLSPLYYIMLRGYSKFSTTATNSSLKSYRADIFSSPAISCSQRPPYSMPRFIWITGWKWDTIETNPFHAFTRDIEPNICICTFISSSLFNYKLREVSRFVIPPPTHHHKLPMFCCPSFRILQLTITTIRHIL